MGQTMQIVRRHTSAGASTYAAIEFKTVTSEIRDRDGSIVFTLSDLAVPKGWSHVATDIMAQKYLRKSGVPAILRPCPEDGVPSWLWRSVGDEVGLAALPAEERFGPERDARQVFDRLAGTWTSW